MFQIKFKSVAEKLNKDIKRRNRRFIISSTIIVLILVPFVPFWFDIGQAMRYFGIGHYNVQKKYTIDYGNETSGINVDFDINLKRYSDVDIVSGVKDEEFGYDVRTVITLEASGDIVPIGFIYCLLIHYRGTYAIDHEVESYNIPTQTVFLQTGFTLIRGGICNSSGYVRYLYMKDSVQQNETIDYQIDYNIPYSYLDYFNFTLLFYITLGVYIFMIGVLPVLMYRIFKPVFGVRFDESDLEREKMFKDFMKKQGHKLRHKNQS